MVLALMRMAPVEQPGWVMNRGVSPGQLIHHGPLGPAVVVWVSKRSIGDEHCTGFGTVWSVAQGGVEEGSVLGDERLLQQVMEAGAVVASVEVESNKLGGLEVLIASVAIGAPTVAGQAPVLRDRAHIAAT